MKKSKRRRPQARKRANTDFPPPTGRQDIFLPFFKRESERFEQICVEIAETEPDVQTADKKNKKFRAQYGVDVEAFNRDRKPILVISCKRYQKASPDQIKSWGEDFRICWEDHWKDKGVERFVLAVTVGCNSDALQDAITEEHARFQELGIGYECWGLQQLTSKLKYHPALVTRLFNESWAQSVCGTARLSQVPAAVTGFASPTTLVSFNAEIPGALLRELGDSTERQLEEAQRRAKEGASSDLATLAREIREKVLVWEALSAKVKARFIRIDGLAAIESGELDRAQKWLDDADALHPAPDRTARALLLYRRQGPRAAAHFLTDPVTAKEYHLSASFNLELGDHERAMSLLQEPNALEPISERLRLEALALAIAGERELLLAKLADLSALNSTEFATNLTLVSLRLHLSLSAAAHLQLGSFPNPFIDILACQDGQAKELRSQAVALIDAMLPRCDSSHQADMEVWRLACLLIDDDTRAKGREYAQQLVARSRPHPGAIAWAIAYGADIERKTLEKTLTALAECGGEAGHVAALALLTRMRRGRKQALKIIQKYEPQFRKPDDIALMTMWRNQLSDDVFSQNQNGLQSLVAATKKSGSCQALLAHLADPTTSAEELVAGADFLSRNNHRDTLDVLRDRLLAVNTARSIELAIEGAFANRQYDAIPSLLKIYQDSIGTNRLPYRFRLIASAAGRNLGDARTALEMLELDSLDDHAADAALRRVRLFAEMGNVEGAAKLLRIQTQKGVVNPLEALDLAFQLRSVDPDLSRSMVENAGTQELQGALLANVMHLACELDMRELQERLFPAFAEQATRGELPNVVAVSVDQVVEFDRHKNEAFEHRLQLWFHGEIPVHLAFEGRPFCILSIYFGEKRSADPSLPMLLHAAGGPQTSITDLASTKLYVDVTALLVAARFGLLDLLDVAAEVRVPMETGAAILEIEEAALAHSESRHFAPLLGALRQRAVTNLETGRWKGIPVCETTGSDEFIHFSPLARTLLDVVGSSAPPGTLCWIEDRCCSFSKTIGTAQRIDVLAICDFLARQSDTYGERAEKLRISLARAGYTFDLSPIADIAACLRTQLSVSHDMAQPELVDAIRDNFAVEVSLLGNLNRNKVDSQAPDIPIEMRYMGRSLQLAARLMPSLWGGGGVDVSGSVARCRWCWRHLRSEQTEHPPFDATNIQARRNLRLLSVFELAMTAAIGDWGSEKIDSDRHRQRFLDWAFREIIDPMTKVEPTLREQLVDKIASSFMRFFDHDEELLPDTPRVALQRHVSDLVNCFPGPWAGEIKKARGLGDALGIRVEDVVTVGDTDFRIATFAEGISSAMRTGSADIQSMQSQTPVRLTHAPIPGQPYRLLVHNGPVKSELNDASFGILSSDPTAQKDAATVLAAELDIPRCDLARFTQQLIETENVERLLKIGEARKESYKYQLKKLGEAVRIGEGVDFDLLRPPAPQILASYLRLPISGAPEQGQLCSNTLSQEVGIFQAAKRLAASTLPLSLEFKREFGAAVSEEWRRQRGKTPYKAPTPLYALLLLQGLIAASAPRDMVHKALDDLVRSCRETARTYCAFLNWSKRTLSGDLSWNELASDVRDLFLMVHADLILGTLVVEGIEPDETTNLFDASHELQLQTRVEQWSRHTDTPFDDAPALSAHILAAILRIGDADVSHRVLQSELRGLSALNIDGQWFAGPLNIRPHTPWHSWSWAATDAVAELANRQVFDLVPPFDTREPDALLTRIVALLDDKETALANFHYLATLDLSKATNAQLTAIVSARASWRIDEAVEPFSAAFHICGRVIVSALASLGRDDEVIALVQKWAAIAAQKFADSPAEACMKEQIAGHWTAISQLIDICLSYLLGTRQSGVEPYDMLGRCVETIGNAWPTSTRTCAEFLVQAADQLDVEKATPIWFSVQRLRMLAAHKLSLMA